MRMNSLKALAWVLLPLLLGGCATFQPRLADAPWPANVPPSAHVIGVPFFPQQEFQCGPAALATTLVQSGVDVSPQSLTPQVYIPALKGSLQLDLIGATRLHDRIPYRIAPTDQALLQELAAGNPVLVLQDAGRLETVWHYAVAVGYDRPRDAVVLQSGPEHALTMTLREFDRRWAKGGRWALVTLSPKYIPASATEHDFLVQVAALETVRPALARTAYHASLDHWPGSLGALLGLGNLAYANGRLEEAAGYFLQATQAHPEAADAFNNLAQTELQLGSKGQARTAIANALALGGPHLASYRKTQAEIEASP